MRAICAILIIGVIVSLIPISQGVAQGDDPSQFPITVVDATGREVEITSLERIVSGSGDVTEIIAALGYADAIVGVDISSTYPEYVLDNVDAFGFARRLTLEPIVAMNPTVFFCAETCMPEAVLDQLRDLGIPVVITPDGDDVDLALPLEKIRLVSEALGVPEAGEILAAQVAVEIDWVNTALANVSTQPYVLLLYFRGSRLQLVYGENTPAEALIEGAGGIEAAGDIGVDGYLPLNTEILLTAYPDYVLLMEEGVEGAGGLEFVRDIQGMDQTPAGQNDAFLVYDDQFLLALSTRTGQMLLSLAADIHPDMTWELEISYPYTFFDGLGREIVVESVAEVAVSADLFDAVQGLGFHPVPLGDAADLILSTNENDLTEATPFIFVPNADDIAYIADALGVPGRGIALETRITNEVE